MWFEYIDEVEDRVAIRAFRLRILGHVVLFSLSVFVCTQFIPLLAELSGAADHVARFGMARLLGVSVLLYFGAVLAGWAVHAIFREAPT